METVIPVAEARAGLSMILRGFRQGSDAAPVVIGSHRSPEAVIVPYARFAASESARPVTLQTLRRLAPVIERLARASRLSEVRVYGSVARGTSTDESDVDLLVSADPDATMFDLAQFERDMELLLQADVSAVSVAALDPDRGAGVLAEAVAL